MARLVAILAAVITVAALGGMWLASYLRAPADQFADCRASQMAGGTGQLGGPLTLLDKTGQTVTDQDVLTGPSLIYFGYTFCPDVCPVDTARNAEATDLLEDRGKMVTPIFVSIDPGRDTPDVVGEFAANLHERMIGLTGSPEQIKSASQAYRVYYNAHKAEGEEYLVDHSTFTYLYMPGYGVVDFFRRDMSAEAMADAVACFIDKS